MTVDRWKLNLHHKHVFVIFSYEFFFVVCGLLVWKRYLVNLNNVQVVNKKLYRFFFSFGLKVHMILFESESAFKSVSTSLV